MTQLQQAIEYSIANLRGLAGLDEPLARAVNLVLNCLTSGHKLLICGNGGSASDATHLATEFLCRYQDDRRPYPALSLTANGEYMTAVCNDYGADEIFARQVWGLAQKGDLVIIVAYARMDEAEAKSYTPRVVLVDAANKPQDSKTSPNLRILEG